MLSVSAQPFEARIDGKLVQPKLTAVFAALAVRAQTKSPDHSWVTSIEIAQFSQWQASQARSVGTEVYNAFHRLKLTSLGWIDSPSKGKLKQWRWTRIDLLCFEPNLEAVAAVLVEHTQHETLNSHLLWLSSAIDSVCLSNGIDPKKAAEAAYRAVNAAANAPAITRASLHLNYARALSRLGLGEHQGRDTADTIEQLSEDLTIWNAVGIHHPYRERIKAQLSFAQRRAESVDINAQIQRAYSLAHQANLLLQSGDTSSAGSLFNTAGCIANAHEAYGPALRWLMAAIPLLLAHGSLMELEAALFNLTLNRVRSMKSSADVHESRGQARTLAAIDQKLANSFNLGREFVQTELLAAKLAIDDGDLDGAEAVLRAAQQRLQTIQNPWEHGCYWRRLAHLLIAKALDAEKPFDVPRDPLLQALSQTAMWMRKADSEKIAKVMDLTRSRLARIRKEESWVQALRLACEGL